MKLDIKQLKFVNPTLRKICVWLEKETGLGFTVTSIYRDGDDGVHGTMPVRGVDLRMRNIPIGLAIIEFINRNWAYDHSRPEMECAVLHGEGSDLHIHLQVHNNTR